MNYTHFLIGITLVYFISICSGEEIRVSNFANANLFSGAKLIGNTSFECYYEACPTGWAKQAWNKCFLARPNPATRNNAEADCLSLGASLALPSTDTERNFITQLTMRHFPINTNVWLGAIRRGDYWFTSDYSSFTYNSWVPGQPEYSVGQCAVLYTDAAGLDQTYWGRMTLDNCNKLLHYSCQTSQYGYDRLICGPRR